MHIAFVIQDLYRQGAQSVTAMLSRGLTRVGHRVDVVVSAVHRRISQERQDIKPFPLGEAIHLVSLPHSRSSRNVLALCRYFKDHRPHIVLPMSSNYEPTCAIACALMRKRDRPKLIPVEHSGGIGLPCKESKVQTPKKFAEHLIALLPNIRVDHVIAVSQGVAQALVKVGKYKPDEITVIHNPVIDEVFRENQGKRATHSWLQDKSVPVIVAAGAHVPLKGYDILIRALSLILPQQKCRLILFGEGPDTASLKSLAEELVIDESVSFPGHIDALPAELKHADVFVVSSHCESFSIVLVEALACGVPVVATNCPVGPPEILQNGQYGILVAPNDPEKLAEGILAVLNGAGIVPPAESWKPYVVENAVARYEAVFNNVLSF